MTRRQTVSYTSVTTVLGQYKEKFDEDYHATRVAERRGLTKQEVISEWREINRLANEYGTNLHEILERFLLAPNRIYSPRDEFEQTVINAFRRVCDEENLDLLLNDNVKLMDEKMAVMRLNRKNAEQAKLMERELMIGFHKWMKENDTAENAEQYFHYSDEDMLNEYLKTK